MPCHGGEGEGGRGREELSPPSPSPSPVLHLLHLNLYIRCHGYYHTYNDCLIVLATRFVP